jgi:hypothetical protein
MKNKRIKMKKKIIMGPDLKEKNTIKQGHHEYA